MPRIRSRRCGQYWAIMPRHLPPMAISIVVDGTFPRARASRLWPSHRAWLMNGRSVLYVARRGRAEASVQSRRHPPTEMKGAEVTGCNPMNTPTPALDKAAWICRKSDFPPGVATQRFRTSWPTNSVGVRSALDPLTWATCTGAMISWNVSAIRKTIPESGPVSPCLPDAPAAPTLYSST